MKKNYDKKNASFLFTLIIVSSLFLNLYFVEKVDAMRSLLPVKPSTTQTTTRAVQGNEPESLAKNTHVILVNMEKNIVYGIFDPIPNLNKISPKLVAYAKPKGRDG
ncbi:MAG: hypothetical protein IM459_04160 [Microcystis sp. M085S1]|nr:hypothetical protein [Microcystis sp. M085S1]